MTDWRGKVVLVTGGSSGLGKAIAAAFGQRGAEVVIAARDAATLERTAAELSRAECSVTPLAADMTRQEDVESLVVRTIDRHGRLDVLVNNAGRSMRGELLATAPQAFCELLDLNLIGVVRMTSAAAKHLLAVRGHVVNIGSLAAKSAGRYLGAYPASKFALAGYTHQLRLELGPEGLHVLLVCPGPIARDEPRSSTPAAEAELPDRARLPGGGVRTQAIDPHRLAGLIVRACERRQAELIVPGKARLLFAIAQLSPRLGDWIIRRMT